MRGIRSTLILVGLRGLPGWHRDPAWVAALLLGTGISVALNLGLQGGTSVATPSAAMLVLSLLIWQPFWEELMFRGILQGQLRRLAWARQQWLGLSLANGLVAVGFAALHLRHHAPLLAAAIVLPALVFGWFRDRYDSILPGLVLHSAYNLGYLLVVLD